ncbi:hypothetical protein TK34_02945 [Aeromonas hydrophila]|nr:hypothetical protein TK34_02945 [Aeromonas hydrophila]
MRRTHFRHPHVMVQTNLYSGLQITRQFRVVLGQDHLAGEATLLAHRELKLQAVAHLIAAFGADTAARGQQLHQGHVVDLAGTLQGHQIRHIALGLGMNERHLSAPPASGHAARRD